MTLPKKTKSIVIVVAVIVVAIVGWMYFSKDKPETTGDLLSEQQSDSVIGKELLATLQTIRNINLDGSIFSSSILSSLEDNSVVIVEEPVGRPHPFAPFP